jgi:hypothetical protein
MSNKLVTLECVYTGAQYFKFKVGKSHLRFQGGKATITEDQWAALQKQLKEEGKSNLIGYEFGPLGTVRNVPVIKPIETVRGLDKASQEMSSPRSRADLSVDDHIRQLDEERLSAPVEGKTSTPSDEHINPDEAQRLIDEQADTERLVNTQAQMDAESRQRSREEARAKAKAEREAKKSQPR